MIYLLQTTNRTVPLAVHGEPEHKDINYDKDKGTSQASSQRKIVYSLFSLLARSFYSTLPGTSERSHIPTD